MIRKLTLELYSRNFDIDHEDDDDFDDLTIMIYLDCNI